MYLQISKKYLSSKENVLRALILAEAKPYLVKQFENEIGMAISYYNNFRSHPELLKTIDYGYLINANELNARFPQDLPPFNKITKTLVNNLDLSHKVFDNLCDNNYFYEVWQIKNTEYLLGNLLILIYRTTILYSNTEALLTKDGQQKVQISSVLEEMLACLWLEGKNTKLFEAVRSWLKNWKAEKFSKELSTKVLQKYMGKDTITLPKK